MAKPIVEFETEYRDIQEDEDICEYYLELRDNHLSPGSKVGYRATWNRFQEFLSDKNIDSDDTDDLSFHDINSNLIIEWADYLRSHDSINEESTVEKHIDKLSAMVSWFVENGIIKGSNPIKKANKELDIEVSSSAKYKVEEGALRAAISNIKRPLTLVIVVVLLKTGLRIGELVNLDERDVYLDHPLENYLDDYRTDLVGKPDSIYVDSTISEGDKVNGEVRSNSNKPKSTRIIPIDTETKEVLIWYLAMRQKPNSDANPILVFNTGKGKSEVGNRIGVQAVRGLFNEWSDEHGWYDADDSSSVKPHWCRHWFTTIVVSNADDDLIEIGTLADYIDFLRGDTASATRKDYIQMHWGSDSWMRIVLEDALPDLLTESEDDD